MWDIVYSYTVHEAIEIFQDTLKNLYYFNKNYDIAVIVHTVPCLYISLVHLSHIFPSVYINTTSYYKNTSLSRLLLKAHMENYFYIKETNMCKHFVLMASNCYFHKQVNLDDKEYIHVLADISATDKKGKEFAWPWAWPQLLSNTEMIALLKSETSGYLTAFQHEGLILEREFMDRLFTFIRDSDILNRFPYLPGAEEFIPQSLCMGYNSQLKYLCNVFWNLPQYTPCKQDILNCTLPCVKRVSRDVNNPIRIWLREETNDYQL